MAFYLISLKILFKKKLFQSEKDRNLGYEPLRASYVGKGEFILVSGSNNCCTLYNKDGVKVSEIGDPQKSWVWSCAHHPTSNFVVSN